MAGIRDDAAVKSGGESNPLIIPVLDDPITISEVEQLARRRLPKAVYDYYSCGADDQYALRRNVDAFSEVYVLPRILRDVSLVDTSTTIFGWTTTLPVAFAPSAMQKLADAGYEALVVTVDTPVLGNRLNERKTPLILPPHLRLANIKNANATKSGEPTVNRLLMDARTAEQAKEILKKAKKTIHSPELTWDVLSHLRRSTSMKIILKGIMAPEDARLAVERGADAIVVSNHGGRQLDCVPSTLEVLPQVAKAVDGKIPVLFDGGVRRGSDVFKAIALGADLVLIGRPVIWGLGYKGQEGVETVVNILGRELSRTMALAGVSSIADIKKAAVHMTREPIGVSKL
ncbi:related to L-lactate dehydrogenase (cytochrome) [Phialocephala subalpina]|uniref:Related to L-lactate dehydrogenase (Cytochrome) n=1 Tax=Phialocephala subalpina TaxID=576137 RepID=A0A1L7WS20_9HELO|nr:related to L-lactate dehydrogenase (cytochrome) [Phialocephala subalpina]